MKIKLLITTLLLSVFTIGCEIEKDYDGPSESWEIKEDLSPIYDMNIGSFQGNYEITSFKRKNTEKGECISYVSDSDKSILSFSECDTQSPYTPLSIKGNVFLTYDEETKEMKIAYKYDQYEKDNTYFTKLMKSTNFSSYVYKDVSEENTFKNFELDKDNINGANLINITPLKNNGEYIIPNLKLVTDGGKTEYNFVLKKINNGREYQSGGKTIYNNCLKDTHTPMDITNVSKYFKPQEPINLDTEQGDYNICKYGAIDTTQINAMSLLGYYEVTRMQLFDYDSYPPNNSSAYYDSDTRQENEKFKGEFWITFPKEPLGILDENVNIHAAFKYQVDTDKGFQLFDTKDKAISFTLDGSIYEAFGKVAVWDGKSPYRTRQVKFKPADKNNAVTIEAGGKKYVAVLTLERLLDANAENTQAEDKKTNYNTKPYWQ